jgi:hypothetical protein
MDETRRLGLAPLRVEAPSVERAHLVVLDEHVAAPDQRAEHGAGLIVGEVQHHAALVAIDAEKIGGLAPRIGWPPAARVVAPRRLNLDDFGAHVAERHGGERPGEDSRQVEDLEALERARR